MRLFDGGEGGTGEVQALVTAVVRVLRDEPEVVTLHEVDVDATSEPEVTVGGREEVLGLCHAMSLA